MKPMIRKNKSKENSDDYDYDLETLPALAKSLSGAIKQSRADKRDQPAEQLQEVEL